MAATRTASRPARPALPHAPRVREDTDDGDAADDGDAKHGDETHTHTRARARAVRVPHDFPSVKLALKNMTEGHVRHVYPGARTRAGRQAAPFPCGVPVLGAAWTTKRLGQASRARVLLPGAAWHAGQGPGEALAR